MLTNKETITKGYTKQELTVFKNTVAALAAAVIKQWEKDGCPKKDEQTIKAWKAVLQEARRDVD